MSAYPPLEQGSPFDFEVGARAEFNRRTGAGSEVTQRTDCLRLVEHETRCEFEIECSTSCRVLGQRRMSLLGSAALAKGRFPTKPDSPTLEGELENEWRDRRQEKSVVRFRVDIAESGLVEVGLATKRSDSSPRTVIVMRHSIDGFVHRNSLRNGDAQTQSASVAA